MNGVAIPFDLRDKRVFVAGHAGMVGSAIVRRLEHENCDIIFAARRDLDLRHADEV
ncbi:MAG: NAD-dependent epimerase/dehydratase family protein, partial [Xanthobacteraceae bacterium]